MSTNSINVVVPFLFAYWHELTGQAFHWSTFFGDLLFFLVTACYQISQVWASWLLYGLSRRARKTLGPLRSAFFKIQSCFPPSTACHRRPITRRFISGLSHRPPNWFRSRRTIHETDERIAQYRAIKSGGVIRVIRGRHCSYGRWASWRWNRCDAVGGKYASGFQLVELIYSKLKTI